MKWRKFIGMLFALFIALSNVQNVSANWYAGNGRTSAYGVKANIWAPSSAPYIQESGESNWVSLPSPYWVQAGWRYYKGWSAAKRYVEYMTSSGIYGINHYGTHAWGSIIEYRVDWVGGTTWCGRIAGSNKGCYQVRSAPITVYAYSEAHVSSQNELNTRFSAVYYMSSTWNVWFLFDQARWQEDAPYHVQKDNTYYYRNYGP